MYSKTVALIGGMASMANAHIKMSSPVPYGASNLNNSPLEIDGSDFPCKQRSGVYDAEGASNTYELGSSGNELSFIGTAVHGGGSCQVSITYDSEPDENSVWKVIKSIEGGCPAQDTEGNLGDDANAEVPYAYSFDIPDDIPAGNGTIAWTWFNKVGNREMYMNCGPVTLTGDGGSEEAYDALPDMLVANLPNINGCELEHGTDVEFPDPGNNVERLNGATDAFAPPNGACGPTGSPGGGNGGGDNGSSPPAPTAAPPTTDGPEAPAPTPTEGSGDDNASLPGGVFLPEPTSEESAPAPTAAPETPDVEEPISEAPEEDDSGSDDEGSQDPPTEDSPQEPPSEESPAPPTGGEGVQEEGSPCDSEGEWNCVGGNSFQRCASGAWSPVMQLSEGTTCEAGQGADIKMVVTRNGRTRPLRFRSA